MMGQCGVVVVFALLFVVYTHGRQMSPFVDPSCLADKDCSWNWQTTTQNGTQFCETFFHTNAFDTCPNRFVLQDGFDNDDRPKPPESISVEDISKNFLSSETGEMEQYTCLRISAEIDQYAASKVKGIQISLRGKEQPDLSKFLCFSMNFSSGLQYSSVERHIITSECFCGLRPQRMYNVSVTTMPVDELDGVHVTTKSKIHSTTGCSDADKINDARCYKSEEALWEPDCILVEQNLTTGFYNLFDFSFNVAPSHYNFDSYQFFIYSGLFPIYWPTINMVTATVVNKTCSQSGKSMPFVTFSTNSQDWTTTDGQLKAMVRPNPSNDVCLDEQNSKINCKTSLPQTFLVLSDPCTENPCGVHGNCTSNVEDYICNCDPGFTVFDKTCKVDPCKTLDSRGTYVSQCENGECIYASVWSDFYCQCNTNFVAHVGGKKCLANPCAINPETNTTFCSLHGECKLNATVDPAVGTCLCDPGYISQNSKSACAKKANQLAVVIGASVSSCLLAVVLFLIVILYLHHNPTIRETNPPRPNDTRVIPNDLDFVKKRKCVLPIYSADDHDLHYEVVVRFCRFLQRHCQCDVSLMEWEKSIGPTVEMWLTKQIEEADVVLLICSKGTGLKYTAKARQKQMDSPGVYGDVFVKALFLLEDYFSRDNACDKFVVTYFDYSSEDDIPVPFRRFAKYKLMQSMEALYLRIHSKGMESPTSSRRASPLEESNYPNLEMGRWLQESIEGMKRLVKSDKKWYHKRDNKRSVNEGAAFTSDNEQPFIDDLYQSDTDSAYRTGEHDEAFAPSSFFDSHSIGQGSNVSASFEESLKQIQNGEPLGDKFFQDDVNITIDPSDLGYPQSLNSLEVPLNNNQMGFPERPYCNVTRESII
ncbi:uncharacterized protein LOC117306818 isoform X2 [Asterias rubens]|uniref:uncharacterized protein LOC117306818 isoform X2 n=1 Tax=Asterias rubens TaxID=7604 RepID=UPI0014556663|nr:uncharacterized protein LOC117306818 isoform X2 [Asterias rubens]